jgi:hypothetical protein
MKNHRDKWIWRASAVLLMLASVGQNRASADDISTDNISVAKMQLLPPTFSLRGHAAKQQILVTGSDASGRLFDLTRTATYQSLTPNIVQVNERGIVTPTGDGAGRILVRAGGQQSEVSVKVTAATGILPVDFERDIQPILVRQGCNQGACHGKARGQNGFQLSLLGFDPNFDHDALTKEARGRRLFLGDPEASLLLKKATSVAPHGGGKRLEFEGEHYQTMLRWIDGGAVRRVVGTPTLERVTIDPGDRVLENREQQQLLVTAWYSDGSRRDVTRLSTYQSNESAIASVNADGLISAGTITGDAAVMARFLDQITVCNIAVPLAGDVSPEYYQKLPQKNFIDKHVWQKLERLRLYPSEPASDQRFLRRATIDIIGRLPTPTETRDFLKDGSPKKREQLVDRLLAEPEFAEHWANKWADLLRPNPYHVGIKATLNYDYWIRDSFRKNKPLDQFTRELISAKGSSFRNGAVTMFRDRRSPEDLTTIVSQLFLGVRLECARCHHHPFEVWGQNDFYSFAAYFAQVGRKGTGISAPISGSEEFIFNRSTGTVKHPLTGAVMQPRPLTGIAPPIAEGEDPRAALASWITADENPYFSKVMVNRVWADMMGRGIVDPVDDLRGTNPPSNGPLLDALAADFREQKYDLKKLIRRIANSHVYGLGSLPNERNVVDTRNYSRYYRQRLRAEVLLDAITAITDIPETFAAMPAGSLAKELWTHRIESIFLDAFGRPDPNQDPPCERTGDTTIVQALHLMNARNLYSKATSDKGRAAKLAGAKQTPAKIVEELYLLVYSRFPDTEELRIGTGLFYKDGTNRRIATEDLLWALLNTPEFVFKN